MLGRLSHCRLQPLQRSLSQSRVWFGSAPSGISSPSRRTGQFADRSHRLDSIWRPPHDWSETMSGSFRTRSAWAQVERARRAAQARQQRARAPTLPTSDTSRAGACVSHRLRRLPISRTRTTCGQLQLQQSPQVTLNRLFSRHPYRQLQWPLLRLRQLLLRQRRRSLPPRQQPPPVLHRLHRCQETVHSQQHRSSAL